MRPALVLTMLATAAPIYADDGKSLGAVEGRHRPMFWVHLHNCAGTTMKDLAAMNREQPIFPKSANWNNNLWDKERCVRPVTLNAERGGRRGRHEDHGRCRAEMSRVLGTHEREEKRTEGRLRLSHTSDRTP